MTDNNQPFPDYEENDWDEEDGMESYREMAAEAHAESIERAEAPTVSESTAHDIYSETNLIKRARKLAAAQLIDWPSMRNIGEGMAAPNPRADANRYHFLEVLFDHCSGRVPHPFFDLFVAQAVDHQGRELNERSSHAPVLSAAMDAAGLKGQNFSQIDETYKRLALSVQRNSLLDRFETECKPWDGESRLETRLIKLLRLRDTPINRKASKYFWLSLYNRVTNPGCNAPISVALIGAQGVGKSFFSVMLCRALMGSHLAAPAALNLGDIERNLNDWLRRITGHSVIANIGEMRGYKKTDIETFKEFTSRTVDNLNQKWGSPIDVPRQWIIVADANSYDGFNRDETGNRRFFPFFVNQGDDVDGQPWWPRISEDPWKVDFEGFEANVWQIMAECREWMREKGDVGYNEFIGSLTLDITEFSDKEMESGRGTIKDETMDSALREILLGVEMEKIDGMKNKGFFIRNQSLLAAWNKTQRGTLNNASLARTLKTMHWNKINLAGHGRGYFLKVSEEHIDKVHEGIPRFMAYTNRFEFVVAMLEEAATNKFFNVSMRRALKRIQPKDDGDF